MLSRPERLLTSFHLRLFLHLYLLCKAVHSFVLFSDTTSYSLRSSSEVKYPVSLCASSAIMTEFSPDAATASSDEPSLNAAKTIKAVIFDMDGTLLDTESLADKAILQALFGGDDLSCLPESIRSKAPYTEWRLPWELKKQILGLRGKEWAPITLEYFQRHCSGCKTKFPTPKKLIDLWEQTLNGMCTEIDACMGAKALVRAIVSSSKASGIKIPIAIATSSRMSGVEKKRTRHELHLFEHIDVIVTGDDPAVQNGKPAPDIYIEAARRLCIDPTECLVFEDALSGVKSGKEAGCQVVAVPDPRFSDDERASVFGKEGKADVILTNLWEFNGRPFGIDFDMKEVLNAQQQKQQFFTAP